MDNIDNSVQKVIDLLERIPHNYAEITQRTPYYNMAATLTDSVLQAGMNYKSVVYPRVYNILSKYSDYRTTCDRKRGTARFLSFTFSVSLHKNKNNAKEDRKSVV